MSKEPFMKAIAITKKAGRTSRIKITAKQGTHRRVVFAKESRKVKRRKPLPAIQIVC